MSVNCFRKSFVFPAQDRLQWFPGHMMKGMNKMQHVLKLVDCLLEVHDARIPFVGRNQTFKHRIGIKPRILLLCKADLAELSVKKQKYIKDRLMAEEGYKEVMFVNARADKDPTMRKLVARTVQVVQSEEFRFNRQFVPDLNLMVCGIPNVGKSSVINALRRIHMARKKHKVAPVENRPGVTKSLMEKVRIVDYPPIFLYDTPGILPPTVTNVETGLKLAAFDYVKPSLEPEIIADYLLYLLNQHQVFKYVSQYNLPGHTDDISEVLNKICADGNMFIGMRDPKTRSYVLNPDWNGASSRLLTHFRKGLLGKLPIEGLRKNEDAQSLYKAKDTRIPEEEFVERDDEDFYVDRRPNPGRVIGDVSGLIATSQS